MISEHIIRRSAALANEHNPKGSAGYFAVVTGHSPGYVKKISPGDWAYQHYIGCVHDGSDGCYGPHVPVIKRLHIDGTGCLVVMEELLSVRDMVEDDWRARNALDELTQANGHIDDPDDEDQLRAFQAHIMKEGAEDWFAELDLIRLCWHIAEMCADEGMHFDLHLNNIMWRESDGCVVVTDPVCDLCDGIPLEHIVACEEGRQWSDSEGWAYDSDCEC